MEEEEEEEEWERRGREWAFAYATHDKSVNAHVRENSLGFKSSLFIGNLSPTEPFFILCHPSIL